MKKLQSLIVQAKKLLTYNPQNIKEMVSEKIIKPIRIMSRPQQELRWGINSIQIKIFQKDT